MRLPAIDALRGWTVVAMLVVNNPGDWGAVYAPLLHAQWHGCTPTDLIFPLFLFLVGVGLALGGPQASEAPELRAAQGQMLQRGLKLIAVGLVLHLIAHWALDTRSFRPAGVLQRIGLCVALVGAFSLSRFGRSPHGLLIALCAVLCAHSLLLLMGGSLSHELRFHHWAASLDTWAFGTHNYEWQASLQRGLDPEGLLSSLGAVVSTGLGLRAGRVLRQLGAPAAQAPLLKLAAALLLLGGLGQWLIPFNKTYWTPSYALWTGGWATLALCGAFVLQSLAPQWLWGQRFGRHAITAYVLAWLGVCVLGATAWQAPLWAALQHALGPGWPAPAVSLVWALSFLPLWWAVLRLMDVRAWRWRI
ncbi:heparan-alpha-glucosaminide N-acetyltransferase domain-containing protein [Ideonella sp.]|jgi:predicted acyltransferase|uniref:heparan-alpha-glucosaminide N-acetyltransferase domain-containing protein n=1 Tax=Ideonella sp. TaxID=1929293 RepID=UPI0037C146CE